MRTLTFILITCSYWLISSVSSFAQSNKGTVSGFIKDANGQALEFVNVRLHSLPDSSAVDGTISDTSGYYILESVRHGNYFILISSLGYLDYRSPAFEVSKEKHSIEQNAVVSIDDNAEAIVIVAQKPLIRQEAGITVVNVEAGILNSGLTAADVLQRTPGATVDKDGVVKLKGKGGVLVLLDGKPLYMEDSQVGAFLKSIPADQIKEIEIITSPSAKYDAAGNAGIINIKLKQGAYEGLNGSVNESIGKGVYPKSRIGINATYKKKRLTLSGGYQYSYRKDLQRSSVNRIYTPYQDSSYYTYTEYGSPVNTQNIMLNGSYDVSSKGTLLWDGTVLYQTYSSSGGSDSRLYKPSGDLSSYFLTNDYSNGHHYNMNSSLGYKHQIDTVGTELFLLAEYKSNYSTSKQVFTTDYYGASGNQTTPSTTYRAAIPIDVNQWGAKVDFTKKLWYNIKMETGWKYTGVKTTTDISSTFIAENKFIYAENIQAGYVTLNKQIDKWKLSGGLRLEHTTGEGQQKSIDSTFKRNYTNLFPSASVTYQSSDHTSYTLLYSKRIQRPSYQDLNPFVYYSDPYNLYAGNPYLLPEYTHQTELTASKWNGVFLATLNYSYTTQPISDVWIIDPAMLTTTYTSRNLTSQQNYGVSFSLNKNVSNWWTMTNYIYLYKNTLKGDVGYGMTSVSKPAWMVNLTHTFKLPHSISAEMSFNYESPNYFGTVFYREVWQLSAGVQKKFMQDNLSVKLAVTDIFWKYVYNGEGMFGDTKTNDKYKWDNRVLTLSMSYRFGKRIATLQNAENAPISEGGGRKK
jgi:iron complex outermembrane receptor protein